MAETITDEQIADLDRRGMRDAAIMAAMRAEALGRYAHPPFWWSRERKAEHYANRQRITRDLDRLLSVPRLATYAPPVPQMPSASPYASS